MSFKLGQIYFDKDRFIKFYDPYETLHISITFALCSVAYILFLPFMKIYTEGTDVNYIYTYMPLLIVFNEILSFIRLPALNVIIYAGHFKETQWRAVVESVINLSVSLILVNVFEHCWGLGIYGVLIGTTIALLYRTNDILFYTNKKLLNRSPMGVYKTCLVNLLISLVFIGAFNLISPNLDNYIQIFIAAAVLCVMIVPISIIFSIAINKTTSNFVINLIKSRMKYSEDK